ncbi:hypothetical protein FOCG_18130 [Fusarium oxysporum f. sp. radicis-lycopersici 26381]|nr:hypothetical protein FOCG_18302 [Fusarium oxysporum f. sp. radicis-lycopersici 26381]EXL39257.1 hypothetical protein FOCG_18130 [Fusarium oxysporum f. sp. radicis-lycopersici 26381]
MVLREVWQAELNDWFHAYVVLDMSLPGHQLFFMHLVCVIGAYY